MSGLMSVRPSGVPPQNISILAAWFFCRASEQFKGAIDDEDFGDLLKDAQADPKGVAARDLLKKVLPFLNISSRQFF